MFDHVITERGSLIKLLQESRLAICLPSRVDVDHQISLVNDIDTMISKLIHKDQWL